MGHNQKNLDREKIEPAIRACLQNAKVEGPIQKPNGLTVYHIQVEGQAIASLNVYYTKNGTTTINTFTGKNTALSEEIASYVIKECEVKDVTLKSLYLKHISEQQYNDLIEFLKGYSVEIEDGKNLPHGKQYKIVSPYGDYVLFNKYDSGSFQVQGANKIAKSWVIEGLTNLLPFKELIEAQLKELKVHVNSDDVLHQMEQILPDAYSFMGEKLKAIISPAIALRSVNISLSDYSAFLFPALRGLEGYIKKLFLIKNIVIGKEGFSGYVTGQSPQALNNKTKTVIANTKLVRAIEESYNLLIKQRHGLFHVDGLVETSRIVANKKEADEILEDVFETIQTTYSYIL